MDEERGALVADISVSVDGYVAGPGGSVERPLGEGGEALAWYGDDVNDPGATLSAAYDRVDAEVLEASGAREGAVIMGRTTFDLSIDEWGEEPPIHKPCFVLTHRPEEPITKAGGTTFTFVTSPWEAVREARRVADGRDVGIMGGAATVRQYLDAGLLDELHLHVVPVVLGGGVRLFEPTGTEPYRLTTARVREGAGAVHVVYGAAERVDRASRTVAASPDEVYRAFADPRSLEQWLPPSGMSGTVVHFDFREGGSYRMRLTYDTGGYELGKTTKDADEVEVRLTALEPGQAIHQEVGFDSEDPRFQGVMRMSWTFRPRSEGTLVAVRAEDVPVGILPEDHAEGLHASLEGLARFLRSHRRPTR